MESEVSMAHKEVKASPFGTYRSRSVQLGNWSFLALAAPLFIALAIASFVDAAHGSQGHGLGGLEVFLGVVFLVFVVILVRLSRTALRITPASFRVINWFRTYDIQRTDVEKIVTGDELGLRSMSFSLFTLTDDRHFFLVTRRGIAINIAALTLGATKWGEKTVRDRVSELNASLQGR